MTDPAPEWEGPISDVPPTPPNEDDTVAPVEPDVIDTPPLPPAGLVVLEEDE